MIYPIKYASHTKTEDMITGISESKILAKRISYECKCKFDGRKCILNRRWNNDKCQYECKNPREYNAQERKIIWNPTTCNCGNVEYLTSTIDDSVIMCDEIGNAADSVSKNWSANVLSTATTNAHKLTVIF